MPNASKLVKQIDTCRLDMGVNMYRTFMLLILISFSVESAEFEYQGQTVFSQVTEKKTDCSGFTVSVVLDQFPREYEAAESDIKIPTALTIPHNGSDRFVASDVYVMIRDQGYKLPSIKTLLEHKPELINYFPRATGNAEYIATLAPKCTERGFSLGYWIGGNGRGADYVFQYEVLGNEISIPKVLSSNELGALIEPL